MYQKAKIRGLSVILELWNIFGASLGTEELAHLEIVGAILYQLTKNLSEEQIKSSGFDTYFVDHTTGVYTQAAAGFPYTAASFQVKGDPVADLNEDLAAEQKARVTYDNILRLVDDPDIIDPIRFLREREVVHYQRFADCLRLTQDTLNSCNFYICNPAFDKNCSNNNCPQGGNIGNNNTGDNNNNNGNNCGCRG